MVLLDLLAKQPGLVLVVAHFEHGIRPDSAEDFALVKTAAKKYGVTFAAAHGNLGPEASEATAREARYRFLDQVRAEEGAFGIITAHHQDDMLETAILNMLRGTGRKGLSSLSSRKDVIRPLLEWTKKDIRAYAKANNLVWHEDSTNADERYLRNYIRKHILSRFGDKARASLLDHVRRAGKLNDEIDEILEQDLQKQPAKDELSRAWYVQLPYAVAGEMMAAWLRRNGVAQFDRVMIDNLVVSAKTARPGKLADVNAAYMMEFNKDTIKLSSRIRP